MTDDATGQPIFPIVNWDIGPLSVHDAITIRMDCINIATQEKHKTQFMALHRSQVQSLLEDIAKALAKLDAVQAKPNDYSLQ